MAQNCSPQLVKIATSIKIPASDISFSAVTKTKCSKENLFILTFLSDPTKSSSTYPKFQTHRSISFSDDEPEVTAVLGFFGRATAGGQLYQACWPAQAHARKASAQERDIPRRRARICRRALELGCLFRI